MSKKGKGHAHEEHVDESWLIPYADLLTLLLALFIVLYAASNVDAAKYNAIAEAFYGAVGPGTGGVQGGGSGFVPPYPVPQPGDGEAGEGDEIRNLEDLQAILRGMLIEAGLETQVTTTIDDRGLVVSMSDAVLFEPGSAEIKSQYKAVLVKVGETMNRMTNYIRIEGHTDSVPMSSEIFPSNWELSGGRAAAVVRLFIEESNISPQKLSMVGYGENRPVADNATVEGRGKNRRVDIIILSGRYNVLEQQHAY